MKSLNMEAEAAHKAAIREIAYEAFLELRDTIAPNYDVKLSGYDSADHARLMIVQMTTKRMNKLSSDHLKKFG